MADKPMPHPNDDADHLAARTSKQAFAEAAGQVRSNPNFSDRYKAEQIAGLHAAHVTEVGEAHQRLTDRRRARLERLEQLVPVGPGIPDGTSPADTAVLMAAFRTALATAREADGPGRAALLAEAERFGDDSMRRAVLTHALDHNESKTLGGWVENNRDQRGYMDEVASLREALSGGGRWDRQDFTPAPQPRESGEWERVAGDPNAQPSVGREVRPGVIEYGRR